MDHVGIYGFLLDAPQEPRFIDDLDAERSCLLELASGGVAGDDEAGGLRHAARHMAAVRLHQLRGGRPRQGRERTGNDDRLPCEGTPGRFCLWLA